MMDIASNQKCKLTISHVKVNFSKRRSATKCLSANTFSGKVVQHSLTDLTVHKWLVGDVLYYLKFWAKVTHPLQKRRFPMDIHW